MHRRLFQQSYESYLPYQEQRQLWYEYVDRYHYLGYQLPFGAQLRYFIKSGATDDILGCFQFSSPAWKMAPRDRWIGWTDELRLSRWRLRPSRMIGNVATATARFLWKHWLTGNDSKALAIKIYVYPLTSRFRQELVGL
ncbi:MAG: DUF4338 domain-containing protein [Deltaproteobacteria bacterium]|nr:DUF4338 domain-containing protein [Deltaproteobacteria bacterium]